MENNKYLEEEFSKRLEELFRTEQFRFESQVSKHGLMVDFVVFAPDGRQAVIDAKNWTWQSGNKARAGKLSKTLEQRFDNEVVFLVLKDLQKNWPSENVYKPDGLVHAVKKWLKAEPEDSRISYFVEPKKPKKRIFTAMPFDGKYDDTYVVAIGHAAEQVGGTAVRVDEEEFSGDIVEKIRSEIKQSAVVIVDVSEAKPNVMFEAGFAHGLKIPCVHISSTPNSELPFDISHLNTLSYNLGQVSKLRDPLTKRLEAALCGK